MRGMLRRGSNEVGRLAAAIVLLIAASHCAPEPSSPAPVNVPERTASAVDLQGHRGARGLHPENTLEGFAAALAIGVTTLEMDVGVTRDGVVVVHHDERLNPDTTRGPDGSWLAPPTPALQELTWTELSRYDVGRLRPASAYAGRFATQRGRDGVRIPRLVDVLRMAEATTAGTIRYNVETKLSPLSPELTLAPAEFADHVRSVLQQAGVVPRTTVQSFDWRTLRHLHASAPEIATACLSSEDPESDTIGRGQPGPSPWNAGLDVDDHGGSTPRLVHAAGCAIWSPDHHDIHAERLREAHGLGLQVIVWTVNEPQTIRDMLDLGVDGIISDYPDRVRAELGRRGMPLPAKYGKPGG